MGNRPAAARTERSLRFERAARAYRASLDAVAGLKSLVWRLGIACDMRDKNSLYLAADETSKSLLEEHRCAGARGLARRFSRSCRLLDRFGFARAGAIVSPGAADADPMKLAHGLLRTVAGARRAAVRGRRGGIRCRRPRGQCRLGKRSRDRGALRRSRHRLCHARYRLLHRACGVVELGDRDQCRSRKTSGTTAR